MIKFIFFDVGGVAIKDFSKSNKWEEMKSDLGVNDSNRAVYEGWWRKYEDRIDIDLYLDEKIPELRELGFKIPPGYSILADFVRRFETNKSLWPVIERVKKTTGVGLLTNMYPGMFEAIKAANLLPPIDWEVIVDSSVVGYKKPQPIIYEIAQKRSGLPGNQILFVDNTEENIETAKKMGWRTFWYDSGDYEKSSRELEEFIGY